MPGGATLSVTESMIMTAMGDFLTFYLPAGVAVVQGQDNRVAEPGALDFITMWPTLRERIETNTDTYQDITFQGSIVGTAMTVTSAANGTLPVGRSIFGVGITGPTTVTAQTSGPPGGHGSYTVSQPWTVGPQAFAAGLEGIISPMKLTIQLDVHGPNSTDNTQMLVALFRDAVACDFFTAGGYPIQPLYIDDGRQLPFINGEQQYEDRWVLEAKIQANPVTSVPMQFAATLTPTVTPVDVVIPVDGIYPADAAFVVTSQLTNYTVTHNISYGSSALEKMDVFLPPNPGSLTGAVVMFHGGGWTSGDKAVLEPGSGTFQQYFVGAFANTGIAVFNANYILHTTNGDYPQIYASIQAALAYVIAHASAYNVNPAAIGVLGNSVGGQLGGMLGATGLAAFTVDDSGPADLTAPSNLESLLHTMIGTSAGALQAASPLYNISASTTPFFITHGFNDQTVAFAQSEAFYAALQAAKVPSIFVSYSGGHVFDATLTCDCWSVLHRMVAWVQGEIAGLL